MRSQPISAPSAPPERVVGVARLANYLKRRTEADQNLRGIAVAGEVSNVSTSSKGNVNFDLKEGDAVVRCFAWGSDAAAFPALAAGAAVIVRGSVTVWEAKSSFQIVVQRLELAGIGNVAALFEARKRALAGEGLFDAARKRQLPRFPFTVGLVSSRASDGAIDFVTILHKRAPHVAVVWFETVVQGPTAPEAIEAALRRASRSGVDIVVLTRGGGSFEDLFCFSDERVVRAVAAMKPPIISAIGHTTDQQLCDYAADKHVETPSAAARAIGFDRADLIKQLADARATMRRCAERTVETARHRLSAATVRSRLTEPRLYYAGVAQRVGALDARLDGAAAAFARRRRDHLTGLGRTLDTHDPSSALAARARRLDVARLTLERVARARVDHASRRLVIVDARLRGNDPEAILQRGYAIVTYRGAIVRDPMSLADGAAIEARVARGTLHARVDKEPN